MNPRRRACAVLAVLLGTALLPVLPAAPASAAPGCLHDEPGDLMGVDPGCDDTTPPETATGATAPRMTAAGWINKNALRVGLVGTHPDADVDPISFDCVLSLDPAMPAVDAAAWKDCPEGGLFTGLTNTASKPYVLWVRAVDDADSAITYEDGNAFNGVDDEPGVDLDETPARLEFRVDTVVPDSYIFETPYDPITPQIPMVTDPDVTFRLAATEVAGFTCTLDATAVPCALGVTKLPGVDPGNHTFQVQAVDVAENVDPSPATTRFAVPTNLKAKKTKKGRPGWKRVVHGGYLGGDYLVTTQRGAELTVKTGGYREVRLLALTGPDAGIIEIKVGEGWHKVSLKRKTVTKLDQIVVFDEFTPRHSGKVIIRSMSQGKRVQLDGILLR